MRRPVIHIDEDKCDGCGQCVTSCAEGALAIVDGKARLVSEVYCDGLGACLSCPQGALRLEEREAKAFDGAAALAARAGEAGKPPAAFPGGCPGGSARVFRPLTPSPAARGTGDGALAARLAAWPLQVQLVPPAAPFLRGARVLLAAHCAGFALPGLHDDWLAGRVPLICCPKLEDKGVLTRKLADILRQGAPAELEILRMSVPCCCLDRMAAEAQAMAQASGPLACHVVRL